MTTQQNKNYYYLSNHLRWQCNQPLWKWYIRETNTRNLAGYAVDCTLLQSSSIAKEKQREKKHSRILNDLNTSSFCGTKGVSLDQAPVADGMQWKLTAICNSRLFSCWLNVFWGDTINSYCLHTILHHSVLFPYGLRFLQALLPISSLIFSRVAANFLFMTCRVKMAVEIVSQHPNKGKHYWWIPWNWLNSAKLPIHMSL